MYLINELYVGETEGSCILLVSLIPPAAAAVVGEAGQVVHQSPLGGVGVGRVVPGMNNSPYTKEHLKDLEMCPKDINFF